MAKREISLDSNGGVLELLTLELVTSRVTLLGGSEGVEEKVFTFSSAEESPMPLRLKGTTLIT